MTEQDLINQVENAGRTVVATEKRAETSEGITEKRAKTRWTEGDVMHYGGFHYFVDTNGDAFFQGNKPGYFQAETVNLRDKLKTAIANKVNAGDYKFVKIKELDDKTDRAVVEIHNTNGSKEEKVVGLDSNDNLTFV